MLKFARFYWASIFTLFVILLMTFGSAFFTVTLGFFRVGLDTSLVLPSPAGALVAGALEIAFFVGWLVMLVPVHSPATESDAKGLRIALQLSLWILIFAAVSDCVELFSDEQHVLDSIDSALMLISIIPTILLYPLQLLYMRHIAQALGDERVQIRTKVWMWLAPTMIVVSFVLMFAVDDLFFWLIVISLLVIVIQYWNTLDRLRRDIKQLMHARERIS